MTDYKALVAKWAHLVNSEIRAAFEQGCNFRREQIEGLLHEEFVKGAVWRDARLAPALKLFGEALQSISDYERECNNPVPDALYKRTIREHMFKLLAKADALLGNKHGDK